MDAKRAPRGRRRRVRGRQAVVAGEGRGEGRGAADRANTQGAVALFMDGSVAASCSSSARRTSWRPRSGSRTWFRTWPCLVTAKGPEATADRAKEIEDLQLLLKRAHRAGRRRAHRGRGGQHPRLLPAHPGGAGRERRPRGLRRWHTAAGPRHRGACRVRPPEGTCGARTCPPTSSKRSGPPWRPSPATRASRSRP